MYRSIIVILSVAFAALAVPPQAVAQDYFMPNQQRGAPAPAGRPAAPAARPAPARPAPAPVQVNPMQPQQQMPQQGAEAEPPLPPIQLPPPPDIPVLPKGNQPPVAIIGVIGVPEVMRASTAAQQVEKAIGERREHLNQDAQKEQAAWREMQQSLGNDRAKLSPEQIRARERELQERITNAQRKFRERNQIIQQAAQVGLSQIERTLIAVIRQVADSRGMNLVLHRAQVALNVNDYDITDAVGTQLNKVLPTVLIPSENGGPLVLDQGTGGPGTGGQGAGSATTVAAPAGQAPASVPMASGQAPTPAPAPAPAPPPAPATAAPPAAPHR